MKLAEMVNSANYASMSYQELVTINFAFLLAIGEVKPLMRIKKDLWKQASESMERAIVHSVNQQMMMPLC